MSFGHVVYSDGNGNVTDKYAAARVYGPEVVYQDLDADGQGIDDEIHNLPEGWTTLRGFTGQYGSNGPVMHASEYIGGALENHIRENAGYYVAVVVDGIGPDEASDDEEDTNIGWAVAFLDSSNA